ncbi:hypothetical protein BZA70DRAFT_58475 [Myxozyma melibiosi]|uniref:PARP-type domain-containing protein n=1 Tax=Myxozyma melibiosi TaxID=54550 RepID=A0ABR1F1L4_9ASCO
MSYRIELASSARAACRSAWCKTTGEKIQKGELRLGVFVTVGEHQAYQWRHWNCVTPQVMENIKKSLDNLPDDLDGYSELDADKQQEVAKALEDGHISDDVYKGDVSLNRLGAKKPRASKTKKEGKAEKQETAKEEAADEETGKEKSEKPVAAATVAGSKRSAEALADEAKPEADEPTIVKRGRGRPKKEEGSTTAKTEKANKPSAPKESKPPLPDGVKRGRGRPRKNPEVVSPPKDPGAPKRGRGRPRKEDSDPTKVTKPKPPAPANGEKRSRGRPRKVQEE